ncbi:MAG TPA: DedA family protein [Firmicutes bacterium]|nr:DedA family protein [Bacillota bacterium]
MIWHELATTLTQTLLHAVQELGYAGVFLALFLEGCWFPISSEVIVLAAGYLALHGSLTVPGIALAAALGFASGSLLPYAVARSKGRGFIVRYSRYVGVNERAVAKAERWFAERGLPWLAVARLLPILRAAISVPAGLAPVPTGRYLLATFAGYLPWGLLVAEGGRQLGAHWATLSDLLQRVNQAFFALALLLSLGVWLFLRRLDKDDRPPT